MQISRHWRLNSIRYRLEGVKITDAKGNEEFKLSADIAPDIQGAETMQEAVYYRYHPEDRPKEIRLPVETINIMRSLNGVKIGKERSR